MTDTEIGPEPVPQPGDLHEEPAGLEPEEDFAAMFEASVATKRIEQGQTIEGTIVAIGPEVAFVNVGGKGEATIEVSELRNDDGALEVGVGDRVQAVVVSTAGGLTLSRRLARGAATSRQLEDAFRAGLPVEGKVEGAVKGGYEVRIARQRAFCPISQIDTIRNTDPAEHVGRVYAFRIIEYKDGGKDLVVSRRALLEDEQRAGAAEVRRSIVTGAVIAGRVTSVREFGAFVDLGAGVQGLLHVSEMGWSRVADASKVFAPGETVTVKVLRIDADTQKIALGLKQLTDDPWSKVQATYEVGQVYTGRVTRLAEFGAFVELEPGVEGLAHASTFAPTARPAGAPALPRIVRPPQRGLSTSKGARLVGTRPFGGAQGASERGRGPVGSLEWTRSVPVGTTGAFEILSIDLEQKRIGVALVEEGSARASGIALSAREVVVGARLTGKVERHEPFGVFVFLAPGSTGLIPMSETAVAKEADVAKAFPVGTSVDVVVLEVDPAGRRIRLSRKAVLDAQEAEELREYTNSKSAAPAEGFGSLADKLRGAFKNSR